MLRESECCYLIKLQTLDAIHKTAFSLGANSKASKDLHSSSLIPFDFRRLASKQHRTQLTVHYRQ